MHPIPIDSDFGRSPWTPFRRQFERALRRPYPPTEPPPLPDGARRTLARSLAIFQCGEAGEGRVARQVDSVRFVGVDATYRACVKLFVREEGRHAAILADAVRGLGGQIVKRSRSELVFRLLRRAMGFRFKMVVLLLAEIVGRAYYATMGRRYAQAPLGAALLQLTRDEARHLVFHARFLCQSAGSPTGRVIFVLVLCTITLLAAGHVLVGHRRALSGSLLPFLRRVWGNLLGAAQRMRTPAPTGRNGIRRTMVPAATGSPVHVAFIMDGNGRWATRRGLLRSDGHEAGARRLLEIVECCVRLGIPFVSFYVFSTENWKRSQTEIRSIFRLVREFFEEAEAALLRLGVRARFSGELSGMPRGTRRLLRRVQRLTEGGRSLTANFCVNYGAQAELRRACRLWSELQIPAKRPEAPSEAQMAQLLWSAGMPPVDLVIRTGGDRRLSNFMLYQSAYAELLFVRRPWPAFGARDLERAVRAYAARERTWGGQRKSDQGTRSPVALST